MKKRVISALALVLCTCVFLTSCNQQIAEKGLDVGLSSAKGESTVMVSAETEPAETEPTETKPAETKPAETEPAETKPAEVEPTETKPAETKPAETEPAETKPAETEPAETKLAETEPAETKPAETELAETEPAETKPAETTEAESGATPDMALAEAIADLISQLAVYSPEGYRAAEWQELCSLYDDAVCAISSLRSIDEAESFDIASINERMAQVKTDAELTQEEAASRPAPTITTTLKDGETYKNDRITIDVFAKNDQGEKIASSVTLNGEPVSVNWDDAEKTSFTLIFTQQENLVVIAADDGNKKTELRYTVYYEEEEIRITLAVDAFTIGGGYLIAPMQITVDEALLTDMASHFGLADAEAMKEALNGAYLLEYWLYEYGYTTDYTGTIDSTYYLSTVYDFDYDGSGALVPDNLREAVEAQGGSIDTSDPADGLGEFCFTWMSGWMYTVNGIFANVGMGNYFPQDGDVWRLQFTLYGYGTDIGNGGWGSDPMFVQVGKERDTLTAAMAQAAAQNMDTCAEYQAAYELIQQFGMEPEELNQAAAALLAVLK